MHLSGAIQLRSGKAWELAVNITQQYQGNVQDVEGLSGGEGCSHKTPSCYISPLFTSISTAVHNNGVINENYP